MKILMVVYDNNSYTTWFPQGLAYLAAAARKGGIRLIYINRIYIIGQIHALRSILTKMNMMS